MRPPEAALLRARNIFGLVGDRMVKAMISDPAGRMTRAVEDRPEDQELLDDRVGPERLVRQHSVITHGCAKTTQCREQQGQAKNLQAGKGKEDQADE
jgi:hypothetical protein